MQGLCVMAGFIWDKKSLYVLTALYFYLVDYTTGIVSDPVKCEQVRDLVANLNSVYITWSVKATSHFCF